MNTCVVGLQWGDEGKGKVVDILAEDCDIVVRYGGGSNAGHTVVIDSERFALHLLPSGSIRPGIVCVIANAVVVDPEVLIREIDALAQRGITLDGRIFVSENAHVVLDYHKREDQLREESLGKQKIGTTIRGIGPCYADKVGRSYAVRMGDFRDLDRLAEKLRTIVDYKNKLFGALYGAEPMSVDTIVAGCREYARRLVPCTTDTTELLHTAIGQGKSVLFEGAQGSLLDLDHGTFPYVTSSNSSSLGLPAGCGVPARMVDKYVGVVKAYTTRVGAGPFPTEQDNATGQYIRERGHEYGTTTGRPRRCGWFDGVAAAYSVRIGSVDSIAMMHLDTLTGLDELSICRAYEIGGKETTFFPANIDRLAQAKPIYDRLGGWKEELGEATAFGDLPTAAQTYVRCIERIVGKPVGMIGVGPQRNQTIMVCL
ncbi:MAG: adenylosuccinate synthase [Planctomycetes bacterium RBG_13_62_9]|nr:MAG: adenylosuccinate synthase [Planctomycetes bacterium RBG_13_62_9]